MSDSLQSLESKSLITRTSLIEGDSRKKSLKLTNKGEKLTILVDGYLNETSDELLSKLNEEERVAFVKILEKLTGKMEVNL